MTERTTAILPEETYREEMENKVLPFLAAGGSSGYFEREPGKKLYYEHYRRKDGEAPKGCVVVVHGYTEAAEKFRETAYYFLLAGYEVFLFQQQGHGFSWRAVDDESLVHIGDFHDLVLDLKAFYDEVVDKEGSRPRILFGHSMGGGVSALFLEQYPEIFEKAILSSPMLELNSGGIPPALAVFAVNVQLLLGKGKAYFFGGKPFDPADDFEGAQTSCKARYDYWQERTIAEKAYHTCALSMKTALNFFRLCAEASAPKNARKVRAKVLLFQAGGDQMVAPGGQERFIENVPDGKLVRVEGAKHEIYRERSEILQNYWDEIKKFLT